MTRQPLLQQGRRGRDVAMRIGGGSLKGSHSGVAAMDNGNAAMACDNVWH